MKQAILFASIYLFCATADSSAESLTSQLEKTARKFSDSADTTGLSTSTVAVFPFAADEALSKKKINFAVSELLTHHILKLRTFQVAERAQLSEVLKEQHLGLSGAIDSKMASSVGQILGARLLVLGNVITLGSSYQITIKLIDATTAELVTSEILEVPIETFEKDASSYIVLVPKTQAIGVFVMGNYGLLKTQHSDPVIYNTLNMIPRNPDAEMVSYGWGMRYWPAPNYMIEGSWISFGINGGKTFKSEDGVGMLIFNAAKGSGATRFTHHRGNTFRLIISRVSNGSQKLRLHLGAGAAYVKADGLSEEIYLYTTGSNSVYAQFSLKQLNYIAPLIRAGIEWKPQQRIGWGIFGVYSPIKKNITQTAVLHNQNYDPPEKIRVWKAKLPSFTLETAFAFYF